VLKARVATMEAEGAEWEVRGEEGGRRGSWGREGRRPEPFSSFL
jgi:hypothetical protein